MKILSMDSGKNRGRKKFLKCFRPIAADDERDYYDTAAFQPTSDDEGERRRKRRAHGSVSGALKAALNKASLVKKFRSKSCRKDSNRDHLASKLEKPFNSMRKIDPPHGKLSDLEEISRSNSDSSSLFSSSSPPSQYSSSTSTSRSESKWIPRRSSPLVFKQQAIVKRDCGKCFICKPNTKGMCLFFVSLVALIFWGKAFAIMACTSTWLLFLPDGKRRRGELSVSQLVDSAESKKRVVIEGLLERNHSRVL